MPSSQVHQRRWTTRTPQGPRQSNQPTRPPSIRQVLVLFLIFRIFRLCPVFLILFEDQCQGFLQLTRWNTVAHAELATWTSATPKEDLSPVDGLGYYYITQIDLVRNFSKKKILANCRSCVFILNLLNKHVARKILVYSMPLRVSYGLFPSFQ